MAEDTMTLSEAAKRVKYALWEEYQRLAKRLPDHHVLAVELLRTRDDETVAIFTIVRNHEPVRMVVRGDARGTVKPDDCGPRPRGVARGHYKDKAAAGAHAAMATRLATAEEDWDGSTDGFGMGEPPIQKPTNPGIVALGTVMLSSAFNLGEQIPTDSETAK